MKLYVNPEVEGYNKSTYYNFFHSVYSFDKSQFNINGPVINSKVKLINHNFHNWISPSGITNIIITTSKLNGLSLTSNLEVLLKYCCSSLCKHIVLIFSDYLTVNLIKSILSEIEKFNIHSILIICDFHKHYFTDNFGKVIRNVKLNKKIVLFNSPFDKNYEDVIFFTSQKRIFQHKKNLNEFSANLNLFSESQLHNTYFNRKLYIGPTGEIKNAPESDEIFGYIQDLKDPDEIKAIIELPEFQKYWFVHKEQIDVCKQCEFRHMCVDNRAPIKRSENEWYHTVECNYNPYIAKWEGEEGYLTLAECGVISNDEGFAIDHEKIAKINTVL